MEKDRKENELVDSAIPSGESLGYVSPRALVVEGDDFAARGLVRVVRRFQRDVEIRISASVRQAIQELGSGFDPHLVFSGMRMPDSSGRVLVEWICQNKPLLKDHVYVVSGGALNDGDVAFLASLGDRLIVKPDISDGIRIALERRFGKEEGD
jgi:CheY-like chemotaxis protein